MDLGGEQLSSNSVEDNSEAVVAAVVDNDDSVEAVVVKGNDVDSSGLFVNERASDQVENRDLTDEWNPNVEPSAASGGSVTKKGHGLKRWKRCTREGLVPNVSPGLDTGKVLKRGLSGSHLRQLGEVNQQTGDFVGPVNTLDNSLEALRYFPAQASSSTVFAMGAGSENSEGRSSKSSTAASAPRHGNLMHLGSPISGDKKKPMNPSGNGWNYSILMGQLEKSRSDPSKKLRGERVKHEKEISQSSLESDSRSSNFVFIQTSNWMQSEASVNYNEERDEDTPGEPHLSNDQAVYSSQTNAREAEDTSSSHLGAEFLWDGNEENDGNHQSLARPDPLVDSICNLDSVREALQIELEKFKAIGKENYFTPADPASGVNLSDYLKGEDLAQNEHGSQNLVEKVTFMESKLEEARDALRIKDMEVSELESTLHSMCLHNGDLNNNTPEKEATKKLESEFECLLAEKVEADIKCFVTANALQDAKHAAAKSINLLAEQKALSEEQSHIMSRPEQTECKAGKIEKQATELETYSANIVDSEQVLLGHVGLCKLNFSSLAQLLMLLVAIWVVYCQHISDSGVVVPT